MVVWGVVVLAVVAIVAALGVMPRLGPFGYHAIALLLVVLPVTIAFTVWEAGRYEATPGKLRVGLRVRTDPGGERLSWRRSILRNLLKFGLPWALAQSAVLALFTVPAPDAAVGVIFAVGVPFAYAASLFIGGGHTIYDWLLGTTVISVASGRRFAAEEPEAPEESEAPDADHEPDTAEHQSDSEVSDSSEPEIVESSKPESVAILESEDSGWSAPADSVPLVPTPVTGELPPQP